MFWVKKEFLKLPDNFLINESTSYLINLKKSNNNRVGKRVLFIIPDGVGIRNYLYSDLFPKLNEDGIQIHLLHNLESKIIQFVKEEKEITIIDEPLRKVRETRYQQFLRETATFARLKYNAHLKKNPTILTNWFKIKNNSFKRAFQKLTEIAGNSIKSYEGIQYLEETNRFKWKNNPAYTEFKSDLIRINPDLVFITHQRVSNLEPLCLAASDLGIPTLTAIFSWDNLPKARLPIRTDWYAVWSDYMKGEMADYYPEIPQDNVVVVGTPQFDFHFDEDLIQTREEFGREYGLDVSKKWVLFSGDDELTSPHDPMYLEDVAEALSHMPNVTLLFRQVPVCTVERYQHVLDRFSNLIHIPPKWQKGDNWMSFYPLFDDIKLLMNLCFHCEFSVNIGSTIGLDFAYFGKPTVFLAYDAIPDGDWSTSTVYQFQHFRSFEGMDAVVFAKEKTKLGVLLQQILEQPQDFAIQKGEWRDKIASNRSDKPSFSEISKLLCALMKEEKKSSESFPII